MNWVKRFGNVFQGSQALITGGMGFIGSNLTIALVELGADVTIVDAMIPGYGANLFNIEKVHGRVAVNYADIRDANVMNYLVPKKDFVFHLAGQVDHVLSMTNPFPDIDINITGTAVVLEAVRHHNPTTRFIYTGTRGQYGEAVSLPVDEKAPTYPKGLHEISNLTAEKIVQMYNDIHGITAVLLRLTNIYGPRGQMLHPRYGVVNWFVRLAIDDETIKVFGDGKIQRDFLYVDDCVEAILLCALEEKANAQVFNVATGIPTTFVELADTLIQAAGAGRWEFAPFTPERKAQEPGDFYADITKIKETIGWSPTSSLNDGLAKTVEFYRTHKSHYW